MIEIKIKVFETKMLTEFDDRDCTLIECSMAVRELERIKLELMDKDFEPLYEEKND